MKTAIVTRSDSRIKDMTDLTHPIIIDYANYCNSEFIVLSEDPPFLTDDGSSHYRILEVYDLLDTYDRILCLDSDMIITKECPNIFDIVPYNSIGTIYEDKGSRKDDRRNKILELQKRWNNVGWTEGYTNAGTFLISKCHKNIFLPHNNQYCLGDGSADLHLSYNIHKYGHKIHELDFKWNHMTMFSEEWNHYADRFKSYIIHYAGGGIFRNNNNAGETKLDQIKKDILYDKYTSTNT